MTETRAEKLARYHHVRYIGAKIQTEAVEFSHPRLFDDYARRIGLDFIGWSLAGDPMGRAMLEDLVLYGQRPCGTRAIDRYANATRLPAGSDEALVLDACRRARVSVFTVEALHSPAGLRIKDIWSGETRVLMDESMESARPIGMMFYARLRAVDDFVMSSRLMLPVTFELLEQAFKRRPPAKGIKPPAWFQDARTTMAVYRVAVESGVAGRVEFRKPFPESQVAA